VATKCFSLVRGRVMRATALDGCGNIRDLECSAIVSEGFISVAFTANIDEGEEITVTNAGGKVCVRDQPTPVLLNYGLTITFCEVNPQLYANLTGQAVVYNNAGDAVGFRVNSDVDASKYAFALELWSNVPGDECEGATPMYGYLLVPFIKGGVFGDFTLENGAVTFTLQNAQTKKGSPWGVGPYDVIDGAAGAPSKLATAIGAGDHLHVQLTGIEPPAAGCSCIASGPKSTSATAGTPGTYTPVDSYPPDSFAELTTTHTLTASPATNWTTGQYIVLADGTFANWNGTAWVAGKHA
jgi:hypothetical protein